MFMLRIFYWGVCKDMFCDLNTVGQVIFTPFLMLCAFLFGFVLAPIEVVFIDSIVTLLFACSKTFNKQDIKELWQPFKYE